ncbi:hypothetical protein SAMD00019534_053680 [Acytostelium subglobosum LB1]|uniref:hypothetical protein n=1 Tax=Acytostelium subglobosum LB1 TaxID=1410327 RepID=UPI0006451D3A|nr:hypothetical protein SAMD00019534_053680 [Acytostelium subglobosum LB1]GAM22193.1 hypothetical protein SAMD00019534_053680 [Acytostelium subglobosum LB1]|eukprot:XP_012755293.1 hypothetical protein SAMD00019534_053680 [Acytostelium subglobosum LB1]
MIHANNVNNIKNKTYKYTPIADLVHDVQCNIYAFVIRTSPAKPTQGTDKCVSLVVGDSPDHKVNVNLFFRNYFDPAVLKDGTIVRLHRARINKEYSSLTAFGNMDDSHNHFTMVYIPGVERDPIHPVSRTNSYTFTAIDEAHIRRLREIWRECKHMFLAADNIPQTVAGGVGGGARAMGSSVAAGPIVNRTALGDITINSGLINVVARVLSKDHILGINGKCMKLLLWDGSGEGYEFLRNTREGHRLGVTLTLLSWENIHFTGMDSLSDEWIMVRKVRPNIYNHQMELKMNKESIFTILEPNNPIVQQIQGYHSARVADYTRQIGRYAQSSSDMDVDSNNNNIRLVPLQTLTEIKYPSKPITNISQIISPDAKVPCKYKILAKLIQHIPMNVQQITRPYCDECKSFFDTQFPSHMIDSVSNCPLCKKQNTIQMAYVMKLILEDETGTIPLILFGQHADEFFGAPAENLYTDKAALLQLESKIATLKNGSAFYCCLVSYYVNNEPLPENVRYQIFDTRIHKTV